MILNKKLIALGTIFAAVLVGCGGFVYTTVGGKVTGLGTGNSLVLSNEKNYVVSLSADGNFSFNVASNAQYNVIVAQQPNLVHCTVINGTGQMKGDSSVTNIQVNCAPNVPVGGALTNLDSGKSISLSLNDVPQTVISANGDFVLSSLAVNAQPYTVKVYFPPAGQVCTVLNATGTADINNLAASKNLAVNCIPGVQIGGSLAGIKVGKFITLINGTDERTLITDGPFSMTFSVLDGADYDVKVKTQPVGQTCTVSNGIGKATLTNVSAANNVSVTCITN
jgi:predicted SpoU family rRNA methylase